MRRAVVTVLGLLLLAAALFAAFVRVFACTDCDGATAAACTRCGDRGRITLLSRTLRPPADPDLRRLLVHADGSSTRSPGPFDDALYQLLERSGRGILTPGDRPILAGSARWAGPDHVVVTVPSWPYALSGVWMGLFERGGRLVDTLSMANNDRFVPITINDEGDGFRVRLGSWVQAEWPALPILLLREGKSLRRFRFPAGGPTPLSTLGRVAVKEGRFEVLQLDLEEIP